MRPLLLLGVDGGATKTVALVADASGTVLGAGRTGSSDVHGPAGPEAALGEVTRAVDAALAGASAGAADLAAAVFCLCGADWPEDHAFYAAGLAERVVTPPIVLNDAFGALRAGTSDGIGVALVLGTGAAIAARGADGQAWFSGERMEAAGAIELGRQVYDALIRGSYGPGPRPGFEDAALAAFGASSVDELVHAVSRVGGPGRHRLPQLAPVLLEAGHAGDATARDAVVAQGRLLAGYVGSAARRVGLPDGSAVTLSGGLLRHPGWDLADSIEAALPRFAVRRSSAEPVLGAVLLAADAAGLPLKVERLAASAPPPGFFDTR